MTGEEKMELKELKGAGETWFVFIENVQWSAGRGY